MKKILPISMLVLAGLYLITGFRPAPKVNGFDLAEFGRLPALLNGRVQPLDSVGRNSLLQIRTRQSVYIKGRGTMSATEWLLEVFTQPQQADERLIFRIDNGEVISLLKLSESDKYFSFKQLEPQLNEIEKQAEQIGQIENAQRTAFQRALMRLYNATALYQRLKWSIIPDGTTNFFAELTAFKTELPAGLKAFQARREGREFDQAAMNSFMAKAQRYERMARAAYPLLIPPLSAETNRNDWVNAGVAIMRSLSTEQVHPASLAYARLATAWQEGNAAEFNQAAADYQQWLQQNNLASEVRKGRWEFIYQSFQGFYHALVIYVAALLVGFVGLALAVTAPGTGETLRKSAYGLIIMGAVVHTICLVYRMALEGRPPVTNLYSSAIFIGWAAVLLGLLLERFYRFGIGNLVAAASGFGTLVIAHNLALGGDTMEMMRAVLDSNFWLAVHVVTITLGYSAMFVAGLLATIFVVLRWAGRLEERIGRNMVSADAGQTLSSALGKMVYGIICFATLFSFVGTVTGGIWADQSWGRFWGWDPKENGALLIVIWCAVYLHVRWSKMWTEVGLMNVALFGNIVTAWSWFGVNMLGVGLHSYGFMDKASMALLGYVGFNLALILGNAFWPGRSAAGTPPAKPAEKPAAAKS